MSTLKELCESTNPVERLRGQTLSIEDLTYWLNVKLGTQVGIIYPAQPERSGVTLTPFSNNPFRHEMYGAFALEVASIHPKNGQCYDGLMRTLGDCVVQDPHFSTNKRTWILSHTDWPLVTVLMLEYALKNQTRFGTDFEKLISPYLEPYFPNINYTKLLSLYQNDFFILNADQQNLITLRDFLLRESLIDIMPIVVPTDLSL